ncbi:MAG: hypothetical protein ABSD10_00705 [Candidatus Saccharimonadales bacterium]|jgi:hypothetical protein
MSELSPESSGTDWAPVIAARYSQELQFRQDHEGEGGRATLVNYVESRIFEGPPEDAAKLYSAMAASSDPAVRKAVLDHLDKLRSLDPGGAQQLGMTLLLDTDPEIKRLAYIAWNQYG